MPKHDEEWHQDNPKPGNVEQQIWFEVHVFAAQIPSVYYTKSALKIIVFSWLCLGKSHTWSGKIIA